MKRRSWPSIVFQRLIAFIHRCIPANLQQSQSAVTRAEHLFSAVLLAALILPAYGVFYLYLGNEVNAGSSFVAAVIILLVPIVLRLSGSIVLAREVLVITMLSLFLVHTYRLGSINAPTVIWFATCPLVATAVGGARPGIAWSVVVLLTVTSIYIADVLGLFPAAVINDIRLLGAVSNINFVIVIAIFLVLFERTGSNALRKFNEALGVIRELAIRDELTGVFNRRELLRVAEQEKNRADRQESQFCFCLIDIDCFKQINDTFGHAAGDQVLKRIASKIQEEIRKIDCFGRYGGEEFLLLLPETDSVAARASVDRIRQRIEEISFPELDGNQQATISAGIAQYKNGEPIEKTILRADHALYRAKHEGRNRVAVIEEECRLAQSRDMHRINSPAYRSGTNKV
jgi:diguanylate cyclase (GGDEF)-like protein